MTNRVLRLQSHVGTACVRLNLQKSAVLGIHADTVISVQVPAADIDIPLEET